MRVHGGGQRGKQVSQIFSFVDLEIFSHPDQAVTREQASACVKTMLRVGDVTGNTHF